MQKSDLVLTEPQVNLLEKIIPWAMVESRFMMGSDKTENRNNSDMIRRLKERNFFIEKPLQKSGEYKTTCRDFITTSGIIALNNSVSINNPINKIDTSKKISIRNGKSAENIARMVRMSDAQVFLTSAGVETIYTAIAHYGVNPFIFGTPIVNSQSDNVIYTDAIMQALIDHLDDAAKSGNTYPLIDRHFPIAIFIPNVVNPSARTMTEDKKTRMRSFNNSVGILVDTRNKNAYVIFKSLDRTSMNWQAKAYTTWLARSSRAMRELEIINADEDFHISDAIILCETPGEIYSKAKLCEKMATPFNRIYPVLMKQSGVDIMSSILDNGIDEYENRLICEAAEQIPKATWRSAPSRMFKLQIGSIPLYVGTQLDYRRMCDLKKFTSEEGRVIPYVACYPSQTHIYQEVVKIPASMIIEIEEDEI